MFKETRKPIIAVHGGAGRALPDYGHPLLESVIKAAELGFRVLKNDRTAMESVTEAVAFLEDCGLFNAGRVGVEPRRAIGDGSVRYGWQDSDCWRIGLLSDVRNPIRVARLVMEKTDHVFILGKSAEDLARMFNLKRRCPVTSARREQ